MIKKITFFCFNYLFLFYASFLTLLHISSHCTMSLTSHYIASYYIKSNCTFTLQCTTLHHIVFTNRHLCTLSTCHLSYKWEDTKPKGDKSFLSALSKEHQSWYRFQYMFCYHAPEGHFVQKHWRFWNRCWWRGIDRIRRLSESKVPTLCIAERIKAYIQILR
jgi:hypothetical protein